MTPALRRLAEKSPHKTYKHAVQIVKGGSVISYGYNHDTIHAEVQALNKLWPGFARGTVVYSMRFTRSGNLAMAKPCDDCETALRAAGVKKVVYSNREGGLSEMSLR